MYVYENIETINDTMAIISIKNAARLSILKPIKRKGILELKPNFISLINNNLYIICMDKNPLDTKEQVFDKKFDIFGDEYVNIEDTAPIRYIPTDMIKQIIK
jgi:hypothetical protein